MYIDIDRCVLPKTESELHIWFCDLILFPFSKCPRDVSTVETGLILLKGCVVFHI